MKKAIIILSTLTIIVLGATAYVGYLYVGSLDELNVATKTKSELSDTNSQLEKENNDLEIKYTQKVQELLEDNESCRLWENQEEVTKKIKE